MRRVFSAAAFVAIAALTACSGGTGSTPIPVTPQNSQTGSGPVSTVSDMALESTANAARSCAQPLPGDDVRCFAWIRTDIRGSMMPNAISGFHPTDLQSAYKLPSSTAGSGQTVAIVDAYDDPHAASDLTKYRAAFGLPPCTTTNGCFKKVNQSGVAGSYPAGNTGWAEEISLDLDMVSATCPNCHILLVEATNATNSNLGTAVNTAASLGANVISNSYGGSETGSSNTHYNHPGHIILASAGDSGTGAQQPCSYSTVVCVGGTTLKRTTTGWAETAWSGTGSGCSGLVTKPAWQTDTGCKMRSEADASAIANPNTGVAVYDTYNQSGWLVFGGTSVSSPLLAGVYALAGNASTMNYAQSVWVHGATSAFRDVTSGSNGTCTISYICHAGVGYDGPTGWGTPQGVAAF